MRLSMLGYVHGILWKGASIGCKVLFLILVVPDLSEGVYAGYYYTITLGLLIGRAVSFGIQDQLPIELGGDKRVADSYRNGFDLVFAISVVVTLSVIFFNIGGMLILMMAVVIVANSMLSGLIRGINVAAYEKLSNLPWIFNVVLVLLFGASDVFRLTNLLIFSYLLTMLYVYIYVFRFPIIIASEVEVVGFRGWYMLAKRGIGKMINELMMVFNIRSVVILPKLLKGASISDGLAIALTLGEGCWQMGMVLVNRNYYKYINSKLSSVFSVGNSGYILSIMLAGSLMIVVADKYSGINFFEMIPLDNLVSSLLFFSVLAAIIDVRNVFWIKSIRKTQGTLFVCLFGVLQFPLAALCQPGKVVLVNSLILLLGYIGFVVGIKLKQAKQVY